MCMTVATCVQVFGSWCCQDNICHCWRGLADYTCQPHSSPWQAAIEDPSGRSKSAGCHGAQVRLQDRSFGDILFCYFSSLPTKASVPRGPPHKPHTVCHMPPYSQQSCPSILCTHIMPHSCWFSTRRNPKGKAEFSFPFPTSGSRRRSDSSSDAAYLHRSRRQHTVMGCMNHVHAWSVQARAFFCRASGSRACQ